MAGGHTSRTRFWTLVSCSTLILLIFYTFFYRFLIAFSEYKTYATIPPIKTHLNLSQFPYILSFFFSLFHLYSFCFFFYSFFGGQFRGKKGSREGGNRPTDLGHKEVNHWGKSKFASFYPKNFLPRRGYVFLPQDDWSLLPPTLHFF